MKRLVVLVFGVALLCIYGSEFEKISEFTTSHNDNIEGRFIKLSDDNVLGYNFTSKMMIFNFEKKSDVNDWRVVDDVVMGGVSKSKITINEAGNGVFSGHVSLENNGGFSSVRHQFGNMDVSNYNKFIIRIKGDGKNYQFRVKSKLNEYHSYKYEFSTNKAWQTIEIPFKELVATFRGRLLNMPSFGNKTLEEIGFLISNKKEESFHFEMDFIKLN